MQDAFHNNCLIRSLMSGVAGGVMGVAFGIFMGAMDPGSMSSPAPLAGEKQRTAMQVLKETYTTTKARSMCAQLHCMRHLQNASSLRCGA